MFQRLDALVLVVACAIFGAAAHAADPATQKAADVDFRQFGLQALAFTETHFRVHNGLFIDAYTPDGKPTKRASSAWGSGVMLSALNAAAQLDPTRVPAARAYAKGLDAYRFQLPGQPVGYQPFPGNKPDELFYDDNCWFALAFFETYELTHDDADLKRSRDAFEYVASGESDDLGGGIFWSSKKAEKNTCANAPAICAALRLYATTKEPRLLEFAKRVYAWTNTKLQDSDGLYFDHLKMSGELGKTKFSYNSALMIRANVLLYRVTNEKKYLDEANRIADAAETKWFRESDGAITDDAAFAHLLDESLLELNAVSPRPATIDHVRRAMNHLASLSRGADYPRRWDGWGKGEVKIELLQQASAVRAFLVAARYTAAATTMPTR